MYDYDRRKVANTDRSTHPTAVQYAVQYLFKRKSVKAAVAETVKKLSGFENVFLGPGVSVLDPRKLEEAVWDNLADFVIKSMKSFKEEKNHWALDGAADHFKQKSPTFRRELKKRVVKRLGKDPFKHDDK